MIGNLFHNYKTFLKLRNENKLNEDSILKEEIAVLEREIPNQNIVR